MFTTAILKGGWGAKRLRVIHEVAHKSSKELLESEKVC